MFNGTHFVVYYYRNLNNWKNQYSNVIYKFTYRILSIISNYFDFNVCNWFAIKNLYYLAITKDNDKLLLLK